MSQNVPVVPIFTLANSVHCSSPAVQTVTVFLWSGVVTSVSTRYAHDLTVARSEWDRVFSAKRPLTNNPTYSD